MNETEDQWLACTDPTIMLDFVQGRAMEWKLRWFACACCRHVWHLLSPYDGTVVDEVEKCIQEGADLEEVRLRLSLDSEASAFEDVKVHDCYFAMPDRESILDGERR